MRELLTISPTTNYNFTIREIAFLCGLSQTEVRSHLKQSKQQGFCHKVDDISKALTPAINFKMVISQSNMRLWQHLTGIKVQRKLSKSSYKYPAINRGAIELIRSHSTIEQKQELALLMQHSKFNPNWGTCIRDEWMGEIKQQIGLLAL